MDSQNTLPTILALIPLFLGILGRVAQIPFAALKSIGLVVIVVLAILSATTFDLDLTISFLAFVVLLSGFCAMLCQDETQQASVISSSSMIALGLALGVLFSQGMASRLFLSGLLSFGAFSFYCQKQGSLKSTLTLTHFGVAIVLSLISAFGGMKIFAGLFLAATFLPLVPFHLPFVGTVGSAKGTLSSFWVVVWLVMGLAELNMIHSSLASMLSVLSLLALFSALYASLATLGQRQSNLFVASAVVAHVSLIWGLLSVFPKFPEWGIGFGVAVAFVLGGICLAFSFVQQRYGWQIIGKLPGLGEPMPRFGSAMGFLVSFAMFLPFFPAITGLPIMPIVPTNDVGLIKIFIMFLAVWLVGGWYLLQAFHQTAFGMARTDVTYNDFRATEYAAVWMLLLGATYSGLIY